MRIRRIRYRTASYSPWSSRYSATGHFPGPYGSREQELTDSHLMPASMPLRAFENQPDLG